MKIVPAILPQSYRAIESGVTLVSGAVSTVQIDFVDGHFAANRTWIFNGKDEERLESILREDEGLPQWQQMNYEFDLMVKDPLKHIDTFIALGPSKIIFHVEGLETEKMFQYFEKLPSIVRETVSFGMAVGVTTNLEMVKPYQEYIDTIQCMGIARVGFQGEMFDERVIEQVRKAKNLFPLKDISVDGGVTLVTAPLLTKAGATVLVVGSTIFGNIDPHGTIQRLHHVCENTLTA